MLHNTLLHISIVVDLENLNINLHSMTYFVVIDECIQLVSNVQVHYILQRNVSCNDLVSHIHDICRP